MESPTATAAEERHAERLCRELQAYLAGESRRFTIPLDLSGHTEFRTRVWQRMCKIPWGDTVSYGELAGAVGCGSPRAIGQACGNNPVAIIIPCHRVIAAHGKLGGFGHGKRDWLSVKRKLLAHEGVFCDE